MVKLALASFVWIAIATAPATAAQISQSSLSSSGRSEPDKIAASLKTEIQALTQARAKAVSQQAAAELALAELDVALAKASVAEKEQHLAALRATTATHSNPQLGYSTQQAPGASKPIPNAVNLDVAAPDSSVDSNSTQPKTATIANGEPKINTNHAADTAATATTEKNFTANFGGGAAIFFLNRPQIDTAVISGGNVVVTKQRSHRVGTWLQANYIWDGAKVPVFGSRGYTAPGIFVGLGSGANGEFLDTFGGGFMIALKRTRKSDTSNKQSLNLGVGYYFSTIKRLADGIIENKPLPMGFESIQYKESSASGFMANLSFGF